MAFRAKAPICRAEIAISLLHDLTQIAIDSEAAISRGYVRGQLLPFRLAAGNRS